VLLAGALLLIFPGAVSDLLGMACFVGVWLAQRRVPAIEQATIGDVGDAHRHGP
jgi:UPF0716 family protein affecting phage T7 exclusion